MLNPAICPKCSQPNEPARTHCWKCMRDLALPATIADFVHFFGLPATWGMNELKTAYHRLAKKYHPDLNHENREADAFFKFTNHGYEELCKVGGQQGPPPGQSSDPTVHMNFSELAKELQDVMYAKAKEAHPAPPLGPFQKLTHWLRHLTG